MNTRFILSASLLASTTCGLFSQSAPQPRFEVVSIKLNTNEGGGGTGMARALPGGRLSTQAVILRLLIQNAYRVRSYQVVGGPDWIESARWDIEAKAEDNASPQQVLLMTQTLLEDRFKLKVHRETRELPVYDLTAAKGGIKLQPPKEGACITTDPNTPPSPPLPPPVPGGPLTLACGNYGASVGPTGARIDGYRITVANLIQILSNLLGRTVIDKTGYTGLFDVHLIYANDAALGGLRGAPPESSADTGPATIFTATQEQLGLKLESAKGPVEVLVVDHVEKPAEN